MLVLKAIGAFLIDIIETVVFALSIFVIVYLLAFQPHEVKGQSMDGIGGFHDGQYILTDKITYRLRPPKRGEVIVFKYPQNRNLDYIKRIIAIPGDEIIIKDNKINLYKDGSDIPVIIDESSYIDNDTLTEGKNYLKEGQRLKLNENEYFVMGDNRDESYDSRSWGVVNKSDIIGRSFFRYWPPNEIGLIKNPDL